MGFFNKLFKNSQTSEILPAIQTEKNTIYAPLDGTIISLEEINDGVFSSGVLGKGLGIIPFNQTVTAPFDGQVTMIADTRHAIGLISEDGIELLIHVGMDTVSMNGKGFEVFVKNNELIKCGQKLFSFNKKTINEAGYTDTTAVIITNSDHYNHVEITASGTIHTTDKLAVLK